MKRIITAILLSLVFYVFIKYDILKNGAKWFCEHLTAGNDGNWFGKAFKHVL